MSEFGFIAGVVTVAATGAVVWGMTQGVSVGQIVHGIEHLRLKKDDHGNWSVRTDDPGDEVGFVKAMHNQTAFSDLDAAELLSMGHKTCEWLHNGSGPNDIITWMNQSPKIANSGLSTDLLRTLELDVITNSQTYLCPDTLHNGTVGTTTPTTTATQTIPWGPSRSEPLPTYTPLPTLVATTPTTPAPGGCSEYTAPDGSCLQCPPSWGADCQGAARPAVGDPCDHARFNAVTTSNAGTTVRCVGVMDPMWYRWEPDTGPVTNPHDVGNGMDY